MKRHLWIWIVTIIVIAPLARGDEDERDKTIVELKAKVATLEKRIAALEKLLLPIRANAQLRVLKEEFDKRLRKDEKTYSDEQMTEAENLYDTIFRNPKTAEAKTAFNTLLKKYPDCNRAGCAMIFMAQAADGKERPGLLQIAIDNHSNCLFGDGVQVGAYARFLLGIYRKETGDNPRAAALFDEMKKEYPFAVDHKGQTLEEQIPKD